MAGSAPSRGTCSTSAAFSSHVSALRASGRSIVTIATAPSRSYRTRLIDFSLLPFDRARPYTCPYPLACPEARCRFLFW